MWGRRGGLYARASVRSRCAQWWGKTQAGDNTSPLLTAVINGFIIATLAALVVLLWFRDARLSLVIFASMAATFTWAGLVGILAPITIQRFGADPAVASSVFVLTSIDLMGFFVFLGLATLILL